MVSAHELKSKATDKTGLSDFGGDHYMEILEAWSQDLQSSHLSDTGRHVLSSLMVTDLCRRLQVLEFLKQHPEIDDVTIPDIIYIAGHERTGTTFLHNLLTLLPGSRALQRWELMHPLPSPETATYDSDSRIAKTQASADKLRGSLLEQLHWVDATDPEECAWALIDGSAVLGGAATVCMPITNELMRTYDIREAFKEYRKVMKILLWKHPLPEDGRLVLKSPQFTKNLIPFSEVFPEAQFAITHRDPFRASTSVMTLTAHINRPFSADEHIFRNGGEHAASITRHTELACDRLIDFDKTSDHVLNIRYADFVSNPEATVESICKQFGIPYSQNDLAALQTFVEQQKAGRRKAPPKTMPTFGVDHDAFLARPKIAAYCEHFGLEPERKRQTGA